MTRLIASAVAVATAMLAVSPSHAADNPLRERVRQWEIRVMERALGADYVKRLAPRPEIVGGVTAPAGKWPFQVALLDASTNNNYQAQFCGGTLVHSMLIRFEHTVSRG